MTHSILGVRGIGQATSVVLAKHGFKTAEDLAKSTVAQLAATPGFSETRAAQVIEDALSFIASGGPVSKKAKVKPVVKEKKPAKSRKSPKKPEKEKNKDKDKKKKKKKKDKKSKKNKKAKKSKSGKKSK